MWFDIKSEWRTDTVVQLCQAMRVQGAYDALPILADALQDAHCDNAELLLVLRTGACNPSLSERLVAIIMSEKTATAVPADNEGTRWGPFSCSC